MKAILIPSLILYGFMPLLQTPDLTEIRRLYQRAALFREDAVAFFKLMQPVDSTAIPLLNCYKGAAEMVQAKYAINPIVKLERFNQGKALISAAFNGDSLDLEMHFIRFSIQNKLPSFLGYNGELNSDKRFILARLYLCPDSALRNMISHYLSSSGVLTLQELKQYNK